MKVFYIQKYSKMLIITTTILIITLGISELNYQLSQPSPLTISEDQTSQPGNDPSLINTLNQSNEVPIQQSINWNQSLILDPANVFCNDDGACGGIVEVAFESNNTLVLKSYNHYRISILQIWQKILVAFKFLIYLQRLKMEA